MNNEKWWCVLEISIQYMTYVNNFLTELCLNTMLSK